ncbi:Arc family DNA-binding protein [Giesbergeria anulus]|uniref:Arc-like DNA binding domain-containing protein n=1 Tax=Giesbergeria anulus TaxID=180197 RepID=A0A1H9E5R9_9BURK|nr:Arc family DNA-binding protein [Giesbergeria anulus]SEQ20952.1 Arc-like DNA binding domain-containing protein [Giesbergeria anulus]
MATNNAQADWQKTALRLPRDLHQQVHEVAKAEDRTFNGQIVAFLRECIKAHPEKGKRNAAQA